MRVVRTFVPIDISEQKNGRAVYFTEEFDPPCDGATIQFIEWPPDLNRSNYDQRKVTINWVVKSGYPFFAGEARAVAPVVQMTSTGPVQPRRRGILRSRNYAPE